MAVHELAEGGTVYPGKLPEFHRLPAPAHVNFAVRWFWIPQWRLAPGERSRQEVLPFPACNLIVQRAGVTIAGPTTTLSERELSGTGWAVGALLKPVASSWLHRLPGFDPVSIRDAEVRLPDSETQGLHGSVIAAMDASLHPPSRRRIMAVNAVSAWLIERVAYPAPGSPEALANDLAALTEQSGFEHPGELASVLGVSPRTLQRLALRFVGLTPHQMLLRHRLQAAATRLRRDRDVTIATIAADLGYSDHAHFTKDFVATFGITPRDYRGRNSGGYVPQNVT